MYNCPNNQRMKTNEEQYRLLFYILNLSEKSTKSYIFWNGRATAMRDPVPKCCCNNTTLHLTEWKTLNPAGPLVGCFAAGTTCWGLVTCRLHLVSHDSVSIVATKVVGNVIIRHPRAATVCRLHLVASPTHKAFVTILASQGSRLHCLTTLRRTK
jgi:hypothetical protein